MTLRIHLGSGLSGIVGGEDRVLEAVTAKDHFPLASQTIDCVKDLIPAVLCQACSQRIKPDYRLVTDLFENIPFNLENGRRVVDRAGRRLKFVQ